MNTQKRLASHLTFRLQARAYWLLILQRRYLAPSYSYLANILNPDTQPKGVAANSQIVTSLPF